MHLGEGRPPGTAPTQALDGRLDGAVRREPWQVLEQGHGRASLPLALGHPVLTLLQRRWEGSCTLQACGLTPSVSSSCLLTWGPPTATGKGVGSHGE